MMIHTGWRPSASANIISQRANMLNIIRDFMQAHSILEVETPVLCHATVTDPHIESLNTVLNYPDQLESTTFYLQTSPEYAMKRLLTSGIGAIYQISRVFRDKEIGRLHNPEFTLLEWYQPGYDHHAMMNAVEQLIILFGFKQCARINYADIFKRHTGIDPHNSNDDELFQFANKLGLHSYADDKSFLLDFIFNEKIAPNLSKGIPTFIYDFPECLSALAKLSQDSPSRAERFELYINGVEIANGFNELCDANEQKHRFEINQALRKQNDKTNYVIDKRLINALDHGLSACAGVAIGLDRLLMMLVQCDDIKQVLTFPIDIA
jgi:lysyl-tRNA synthetase class 2